MTSFFLSFAPAFPLSGKDSSQSFLIHQASPLNVHKVMFPDSLHSAGKGALEEIFMNEEDLAEWTEKKKRPSRWKENMSEDIVGG